MSGKKSVYLQRFYDLLNAVMVVLLCTILLIALAVILLGVRIFFVKGGRFPDTHIHSNAEMRRRGITCAQDPNFYE